MKPTHTWPEIIGFALGVLFMAVGVMCLQAWALVLVLGWFGVVLAYWKALVIVLLIGTLLSANR